MVQKTDPASPERLMMRTTRAHQVLAEAQRGRRRMRLCELGEIFDVWTENSNLKRDCSWIFWAFLRGALGFNKPKCTPGYAKNTLLLGNRLSKEGASTRAPRLGEGYVSYVWLGSFAGTSFNQHRKPANQPEALQYHPTDRALDRACRVTMPELKG